MKLKSIILENFRAFRRLVLPLDPKLTVLVGDNAAGKSTLLDAMAVGLGAMVGRFPNISGSSFKAGDSTVTIRSSDIQRDSIDVTDLFSDPFWDDENTEASFSSEDPQRSLPPFHLLTSNSNYVRVSLETLDGVSWDRTERSGRSQKAKKLIPPGKGLSGLFTNIDPIIEQLSENPDHPIDIPVVAYYGTERAVLNLPQRRRNFRKNFSRFEALQDALKATSNFKGVFEWFIAQEDEERREKERRKDWEYRLPMLEAVRCAIERMIPGGRAPRTETNPLRFVINLEIEQGRPELLALDQLSDGYRTLLALVMDLARRMAQANPHRGAAAIESESMVMIDEVDLHLHPRWQQRVLVDLMEVFPNTQFIVTTHSPQVLTSVRPEHVVRLSRTQQGIIAESATSTYGAESNRLLEEVMAVSPRPPAEKNEFTRLLAEYQILIDNNEGDSESAQKVREQLDALSGDDPALLRADMEIRRRRLLGK